MAMILLTADNTVGVSTLLLTKIMVANLVVEGYLVSTQALYSKTLAFSGVHIVSSPSSVSVKVNGAPIQSSPVITVLIINTFHG